MKLPTMDPCNLDVREILSGDILRPATRNGLTGEELLTIYTKLCEISKNLQDGVSTNISGYRVQVPTAGEIIIEPSFKQHEITCTNRYEVVIFCALLEGQDLLRRCKKCPVGVVPALFVKNKGQEYCSRKCCGRERVRNWRASTTK
jgi:hypothetical protein